MKPTYLLLGVIAPQCIATSLMAKTESDRPNIIFILTDDQPRSLHHYAGNELIQTPNIDRLADEGVYFSNARVSSAISKPSRTCLLTGQYERAHGVNFNSGTSLSAEGWARCYPNLLRASGYYTGYIGKNHTPIGDKGYNTGLMESSYDYWYGSHQNVGFYSKEAHEIYKGAEATTQPEILGEGMMDFLNPNERNLEGAKHFLDNLPDDQPFFLNVCFNLPHNSSTSAMRQRESDPDTYCSLYRDLDIPLPKDYVAKADIEDPKLPAELLHAKDRQTTYDYVDTPEECKERYIRYMQAVTGIDNIVGELQEELKRQGLDENTIIIFTSDHGIFFGEYGLGGKSLCYEICTRVPYMIYDPRLPKKVRSKDSDELVMTIDLSATMLDYAGVEVPEHYQGFSLRPMIEGEQESVREYAYTENLWSTVHGNPRCESVQDKEWKYIRYYKNENLSSIEMVRMGKEMGLTPKVAYDQNITSMLMYRMFRVAGIEGEPAVYEELYNLKNDPLEAQNVIDDPKNQGVLARLRKEWKTQITMAMGDELPKVELKLE